LAVRLVVAQGGVPVITEAIAYGLTLGFVFALIG
jgi:hypothetical protein